MANLSLKNVTAGAIKSGLDLAIRDREFVVLTGPAGSGCSTIVRAIAGLDGVSQGEIFFDDRCINAVALKDRDLALLARDYTPYSRLSVFENLAIGLRRRNFADTEIKKRVAAVAAALGLEAQLQANTESLSAEQRCFVGLARTMVRQPKVYLFDEPFADLDAAAARHGRAEIVKLHQRSSATVVYATSDPSEALALGQRTVVLVDGVIQQEGAAQSIYDAPANLAVAKFFGEPPMNLVTGTLKQERSGLVFSEAGDGTIVVPLPLDRYPDAHNFLGKSVVLGFRPEDIEVDPSPDAGKPSEGSFRALVERAELKGLEADLFLQTGAHSLIARNRGWVPEAEGGHRLRFGITLAKTHLFDPDTGRRLTWEH
ncbi:MAG TPA: ABC transporter ATP-binding protein [Chthoniobacterales bacterium]